MLATLAVAALHFLWLVASLSPAIMSPDANGYVVQARLIANEGRTWFSPASPLQYVGMHWLETTDGTFHSRYPGGLPLLQAAAWKLGGLDAAVLVNPVLASATVLLVFVLARRFVPPCYAFLTAAIVALLPTTNQHALDADAHVAAAFFLVAGVTALLRFVDTRAVVTGLVAGVLLGAVPTIRYPEAIVGLSIGTWLLWRIRPVTRVWPAVAGAALPLGWLFVHNAAAYGAFWKTGYALTNEQTGFGFGYLASHALPYLQALGGQGLALVFAFGVAGLAALIAERERRADGLLFAGLVVPLVLLYMAYYFGGGGAAGAGGNLRFLVPTFPFIAIAAVWFLARIDSQLGTAGRAAVGAVMMVQLIVTLGLSFEVLGRARASLGAAARVRSLASREIPAGSILVVDRQLAESLDATGAWRLAEENLLAGGGAGPGFGPAGGLPGRGPGGRGAFRPLGPGGPLNGESEEDAPNPMQRGKNRAQQARYAELAPRERRERAWEDLSAWAAGQPVYWLARSVEAVEDVVPDGAKVTSLGEVDAPPMFGPGGGGPPAGPGPGATKAGPMVGGRGGRAMGPPGVSPGGPGLAGGPGGRRGPLAGGGGKLRLLRVDWPKP